MRMMFKSIGAVAVGLLFIIVSHTGTDAVLMSLGVLPKGHLNVGTGLIILVICYRSVFTLVGCFIAAKLAPQKPMSHALVLGTIGLLLAIVGAIATANMNLGPAWYAWSLVAVAIPMSWLGGRLYQAID